MRGINKKNKFKRLITIVLSFIISVAFMPSSLTEAFAEAVISEYTAAEETDESLKYQVLTASPEDSTDTKITVNGMMPSNAEVTVQSTDDASADNICAYDITIVDSNGEEFQPENGDTIKVRIKNDAIKEAVSKEQKLRVWHIDDNGLREEIKNFKVRNGAINFETTGFSVFEVDDGSPPLRTYYFKMPENQLNNTGYKYYYFPTSGIDSNGNHKMICQQTIKNGEKLIFPQLPADVDSRFTFIGWFVSEGDTLSDTPYDFDNIEAVTQNETVTLCAVFKSCVYVIFHDQYNGKSHKFPVMATRRGDLKAGSATDVYGNQTDLYAVVDISDLDVVYDDEDKVQGEPMQMAFKGWAVVPEQYQTQEDIKNYTESTSVNVINTDTIIISATTRLYPVFEPIRWLEFNTNQDGPGENANHYSGATYKPPEYFSSDEGFDFSKETPPVLLGYVFTGWYTENGTPVTDGNLELVSNLSTDKLEVRNNRLFFKDIPGQHKTVQVDLYAHWTPSNSTYTVVIWRQKESDDRDAVEKTYDFAESRAIDAMTEATVSVADEFKNLSGDDYTGFFYSRNDDPKIVAGNGSTVLNVYYDRCKVVYTFRPQSGSSYSWEGLYGQKVSKYEYVWDSAKAWRYKKNPNTGITYLEAFNSIDSSFSNYNSSTHTYTTEIEQNGNNSNFKIVHVLQDLNGNYDINNTALVYTTNASGDDVTFNFTNKFEGFLVYGYSHGSFTANPSNNAIDQNAPNEQGKDKSVRTNNSNLYVYHKRRSHELTFVDSRKPSNEFYRVTVLYQESLAGKQPPDPDTPAEYAGYSFSGWYYDQNCSSGTNVNFSTETMPNANKIIYAGWQTQWFKIEIDPNGGALTGSQATWFWEPYNGDPIEEYKTATRDFEPDVNGEYYYALKNRAYYGLGEEWDPAEDTTYKNQVIDGHCTRGAYYTTDVSEASSAVRYKEVDGAYRYLGWFEVDPVTGKETPFNFGTRVLKNTYLRLHWKQLGTYFIKYDAGEGTIDEMDSNEHTFEFLDADNYADHADIVVTRVALAPEGKNFIGWKIRNDPSNKVYYPGQSFQFSSDYASFISDVDENGDVVNKQVIFLDAVYEDLKTAKIIYDPNGGTLDSRALSHAGGQDNSRAPLIYSEGTDTPLSTEVEIKDNQLVVSDLMNNSAIKLADGIGFTNPGYTFAGWSTTPNGQNGATFKADSIKCYVDINEPLVLYAQWETRVYFDKNNVNAQNNNTGWGGDWTDSGYVWSPSEQLYYIVIRLGTSLEQPGYSPVSDAPEEMFKYWSLVKQTSVGVMETPFSFDTPITKELMEQYSGVYTDGSGNTRRKLTLYGCWDAPIKIPVHIVDTTDKVWIKHDDWLKNGVTHITIRNEEISLANVNDANVYADANKTTGKEFVFTGVAGNGDNDYLNLSEENTITAIRYDTEDMKVKVKYSSDGLWHVFDTSDTSPEAVYFVYYTSPKNVPVGYKKISIEGEVADVTPLNSNAPRQVNISATAFDMGGTITSPISWATSNSYRPTYYSFAIGDINAADSAHLHIISEYSDRDQNRPKLYLKNTWQGYEYSLDGTEWHLFGYDIQLYVLYYEVRPTVVNLTEKTIGLPEDMSELFDYSVNVKKVTTNSVIRKYYYRTGNYNYTYHEITDNTDYALENTLTSGSEELYSQPLSLSDDQTESFVLLYSETSPITTGYTSAGETIHIGRYDYPVFYQDTTKTYIAQKIDIVQTRKDDYETSNDAVTGDNGLESSYTSTSVTDPVTITYTNTHQFEKHLHLAIAKNGAIIHNETLRTDDAGIYSHIFGGTWDLSAIDKYTFINDAEGIYGFYSILAGNENSDNVVTPVNTVSSITSLSFGSISDEEYGFYLNGDSTKLLGDNEIYLVYFERPNIRYMLRNPKDGELVEIDQLQKNGADFMRNGNAISQNEMLPVSSESELLISQISTPGNPAFLIPDLLDHNEKHSVLDLSEIGIKNNDGVIETFNSEDVYLRYSDSALQYHFTDSDTPHNFNDELVVYAIYKIRGYALTLTKSILGNPPEADPGEENVLSYVFSIYSDAIADGEYYIGGYGNADTISASENKFVITIQKDAAVTIYGLSQGDYTITEETTGGFTMTASINGRSAAVNSNQLALHINADTRVDIVNIYPVPITGNHDSDKPYMIILLLLAATVTGVGISKKRRERFYENSPI